MSKGLNKILLEVEDKWTCCVEDAPRTFAEEVAEIYAEKVAVAFAEWKYDKSWKNMDGTYGHAEEMKYGVPYEEFNTLPDLYQYFINNVYNQNHPL